MAYSVCKEVIAIFTGIIEELGTVDALQYGKISIRAERVLKGTRLGDSIAVNGVCLTVTAITNKGFTADVMPETLRCTSLGSLRPGSGVNLERALALGDRLGGHIVSGHVDGTGIIEAFSNEGNAVILRAAAEQSLLRHMVAKGSVAIDGISLTIVAVDEKGFSVSLIPHTRKITSLKDRKPGDRINLETDILAKYVEKLLSFNNIDNKKTDGISRELLLKYGF